MKKRPDPFSDERGKLISLHARNTALEFVIAATQLLTIICLIKGNPAWKGSSGKSLLVQDSSALPFSSGFASAGSQRDGRISS